MSKVGSAQWWALPRPSFEDLLAHFGAKIVTRAHAGLAEYWAICPYCGEDVFLAYERNDAAAATSMLVHIRECPGALPLDETQQGPEPV